MTDETTLLPCPFCGGEAEVIEAGYGMYMTGYAVYCRKCCLKLGVTGRLGETYEWSPVFDTEAEAIAAWNTRAERGTLTAEQVREAVMSADRWEKPMGDTGLTNTHLIIRDDGWKAIADELNAELGSGTCAMIPSFIKPVTLDDCQEFCCSACGEYMVIQQFPGWVDEVPNYCPNCGAKAVGR